MSMVKKDSNNNVHGDTSGKLCAAIVARSQWFLSQIELRELQQVELVVYISKLYILDFNVSIHALKLYIKSLSSVRNYFGAVTLLLLGWRCECLLGYSYMVVLRYYHFVELMLKKYSVHSFDT